MAGQMRPTLTVLSAHMNGHEFVLPAPVNTLGRAEDCDVVIDLPSISRVHARFDVSGGVCTLTDLGSRNGIRVNGMIVQGSEVRPGDVLHIGDIEFRFDMSAVAAPAQPVVSPDDPTQPRPMTGMDIVAAAQSAAPPDTHVAPVGAYIEPQPKDSDSQTGPVVTANGKPVLIIGLILAVVVIMGIFITIGIGGDGVAREARSQVLLRVNERKWSNYPRGLADFDVSMVKVVGENDDDDYAEIDGKYIVDVKKFDNKPRELEVKANRAGRATLKIITRRRETIYIRVIITGIALDPLQNVLDDRSLPEDRRKWAAHYYRNGKTLLPRERGTGSIQVYHKDAYRALLEFRKAIAAELPLSKKARSSIHGAAKAEEAELETAINREWMSCWAEAETAIRGRQYRAVIEACEKALNLIPDPTDPRHQKASFYRWKYVEIHEKATKRAKKG
jgi:FHA domain